MEKEIVNVKRLQLQMYDYGNETLKDATYTLNTNIKHVKFIEISVLLTVVVGGLCNVRNRCLLTQMDINRRKAEKKRSTFACFFFSFFLFCRVQ